MQRSAETNTLHTPATSLGPGSFISGPTPLEPAPRLAGALGLGPDDVFIKRDDLTGLGGGGNKVRKLTYACAEAIAAGATTIITTGAAQSNHARLTAAAGARLGLNVVLVLEGDPPPTATGNIILDNLFDARIVWTGKARDSLTEQVQAESAARTGAGEIVYEIPFGGSTPVTAQGYADCARELTSQLPDIDHVVVAVGSGGTMAGLVYELGADKILGVDTGAVQDARIVVANLLRGMEGNPAVDESDLRIDENQIGQGYSHLTAAVEEAMRMLAQREGLVVDPVYSGRALAGLISAVREGRIVRGDRTVFLHTGGLPGFFGHAETVATFSKES